MKPNRKHLDFELNLIPFIDLLSVCICFLLLTAVWLNIGSMSVKQAIGGQSQAETEKKPMVWMSLNEVGDVSLSFQDSNKIPKNFLKMKVPALAGKPNIDELAGVMGQIKQYEPNLLTALIQPVANSAYEDIISLMDSLKKLGLNDLGVVPL